MKYKKFFLVMLITALLSSITSLIAPLLIRFNPGSSRGIDRLFLIIFILVVSYILRLVLVYVREKFAKDFNSENFYKDLRLLAKSKYDFLIKIGMMNALERIIMHVNAIYMFMTGSSIKLYSSLLSLFISLLIVAFIDIRLCLVLAALIPINYFSYKRLNKSLAKKSKTMQEISARNWQLVLSYINSPEDFKQIRDFEDFKVQIGDKVDRIYGSMADVNIYAQTISESLTGFNNLVSTIILVLMAYFLASDDLGFSSMIIMIVLMPIYFTSLNTVVNSNISKADLTASEEFIKSIKENLEEGASLDIDKVSKLDIDIEKIETDDFSVDISHKGSYTRGDIVWIRGASGSGKSSLGKSLVNFRTPKTILINDIDLVDIDKKSLRDRIIYMPQDPHIINASIRENLFFNSDYSKKKEEMMKDEKLLSSIFKDKTMDTIIGPDASNLSGGEKQKLALIRYIYQDSDVIIADEISSSLDKENSKDLYKRLKMESKDKIIFIISHDDGPRDIANKLIDL